jgi:hypothetical protein
MTDFPSPGCMANAIICNVSAADGDESGSTIIRIWGMT